MKCIVCETPLTEAAPGRVFESQHYCESCFVELGLGKASVEEPEATRTQRRRRRDGARLTGVAAHATDGAEVGSTGICLGLGFLFMVTGLYFLVLAPGETTSVLGTTVAVANLQRLTIGETSSIVGAIFLAAGLRPRWIGRNGPESPP